MSSFDDKLRDLIHDIAETDYVGVTEEQATEFIAQIKQEIKDLMLDLIKQSKESGTPLLWLERRINEL